MALLISTMEQLSSSINALVLTLFRLAQTCIFEPLGYKAHWQKQVTDTAFPPYWFFYSAEDRDILHEIINATHHVAVHVPVVISQRLIETKQPYFSTSGQVIKLKMQE